LTVVSLSRGDGVTVLDLDRIRTDGGTQPRDHINVDVAKRYADDLVDGATFPPVTVFFDGADYWLADGYHRVTAYGSLGLAEVPVDLRQGTRRDAVLYSVGANATHGYPRSNDDKRQAVMTLLRDDEWSQWSAREIARRCAVSVDFAARLKNQHEASLSSNDSDPPAVRTYTTKHGTVTTMKTEAIGRRAAGQGEVWVQTDVEDFAPTGQSPDFPAAPRFPPAHARPAEHIRVLIEDLDKALVLTPAQAAAATGGDTARFAQQIARCADWLTEFLEELAP
jgi:hypothetical protein